MSKQILFNAAEELEHILTFWRRMKDERNGGFYGRCDYNLETDKHAEKSGVAAARNLWTFSKAYQVTEDKDYLTLADHAFGFLLRHLFDPLYGGSYWLFDHEGTPVDTNKHVYQQAFCVLALSQYYLASGSRRAIELAMKFRQVIEEKGWNETAGAYGEEFSREWAAPEDLSSGNADDHVEITTGTHLHILEAYTVLYRAVPTKPVRDGLSKAVEIFASKIYSPEGRYSKVFCDEDWNELYDLKSYGQDIEASWLLDNALKALSLKDERYQDIVTGLAGQVLESAVRPDGSVIYETEDGEDDETRVWWVQAEAAVGFLNAWEKTDDEKFYRAFVNVWDYIREYIVDKRPGGEWLHGRDADGSPLPDDIAEALKAPYHNSRCCMEIISRLKKYK